jgi:hypothetical protein
MFVLWCPFLVVRIRYSRFFWNGVLGSLRFVVVWGINGACRFATGGKLEDLGMFWLISPLDSVGGEFELAHSLFCSREPGGWRSCFVAAGMWL